MNTLIIEKSWHKPNAKHAITFEQIIYIEGLAKKKGVNLPFLSKTNTMRSYTKEDASKIIEALQNDHELIFQSAEPYSGEDTKNVVDFGATISKQEKYTNIIIEFLKSHPAISKNAIEEELNMPQSTVGQAMNGGRLIPTKYIYQLVCFLADYGLKIDGYDVRYDREDDTISMRKWVENIETIEVGNSFEYIIKEYRNMASSFEDLL